MAGQTRIAKPTTEAAVEAPVEAPVEADAEKAAKLKADLDDLLDEIDGVLEENAATMAAEYIQKGGE